MCVGRPDPGGTVLGGRPDPGGTVWGGRPALLPLRLLLSLVVTGPFKIKARFYVLSPQSCGDRLLQNKSMVLAEYSECFLGQRSAGWGGSAVSLTFDSTWRRPRDSWWGCGSQVMEQPWSRVHLSRTHCPPRLQTAPQAGLRQQDSQQEAPPLPVLRGSQPSVRTLLQWVPRSPPVTLQTPPDTPAQVDTDVSRQRHRGVLTHTT